MKKSILATAIAASLALVAGNALADTSSDATAKVLVQVDPNVAVTVPNNANTSLGTVQSGKFSGTVSFQVDANEEAVVLGVTATDLYKGDVCSANPDVAPLPVSTADGVVVAPAQASPLNGASNTLTWNSQDTYLGCNGQRSEDVTFESAQNGHFSQNVDVTVNWNQPDPEQPKGEYSGYIILHTMLQSAAPAPTPAAAAG
jgi:predicted aspartyl protease